MPNIALIVAIASNGVIGKSNQMPWDLKSDLKYFATVTQGASLIMGRRTCESLPMALPGRQNIVLTRQRDYSRPGFEVCQDFDSALDHCNREKIFAIGGAPVFAQALDVAQTLYITHIEAEFDGDVSMPPIDFEAWDLASETQTLDNGVTLKNAVYKRRS